MAIPKTITIESSVVRSEAFKRLGGSAKYIFFQFLMKRKMSELPRKSGNWICTNNKELVFSYANAQKDHGYSAAKFNRAIEELMKSGFIDIEHYGGQSKGNYTLYGLSERWKRYGKPDFISKEKSRMKSKPGLRGITDPNNSKMKERKNRILHAKTESEKGLTTYKNGGRS